MPTASDLPSAGMSNDEPLSPDDVLKALERGDAALIKRLREEHPDWVPKLPESRVVTLRACNLPGMDLRRMNFKGIDLSWARLQDFLKRSTRKHCRRSNRLKPAARGLN